MNSLKISSYLIALLLMGFMQACDEDDNFLLPGDNDGSDRLSDREIISGLKAALNVGTDSAVARLNVQDSYFRDEAIKILLPPEVREIQGQVEGIPGVSNILDNLTRSMNRAAEEAANEARPIFKDAIMNLSIQDGLEILNGPDTAATFYLKNNTEDGLRDAYQPRIKNSLDQVNATEYWRQFSTAYNQARPLLGLDPIETDLEVYVTGRALDGLFYKVAEQERNIRQDPIARVTDILERVFGRR